MPPTRPHDLERHLAAALACLNVGDLPGAEAACAALRRAVPNHPATLQLHATIASRAGRHGEAREASERSLRLRPRHVPTLLVAARAALALGAHDRAVSLLQRALDVEDRPEVAFLLCHALLVGGDGTPDDGAPDDSALGRAMAGAAARHPSRAAEWRELGIALRRAGRPMAALRALTQASTRTSTQAVAADPAACFALGLTHQDLGDEASAAAAYDAALAAQPDFAEAAVNLGIARQRLGDMAAAMTAYRRAVAIRPDTLARIAQAVTAAGTGVLWLDPAALRRALGV